MSTMAPEVECPKCGEHFDEDGSWEMSEGSSLECPKCGTRLAVSEVEMVMYWSVCTAEEYAASQKRMDDYRREQAAKLFSRHPGGQGNG